MSKQLKGVDFGTWWYTSNVSKHVASRSEDVKALAYIVGFIALMYGTRLLQDYYALKIAV